MTLHVRQRVTGDPGKAVVDIDDSALNVSDENALARVGEHAGHQLHPHLGQLALGDVAAAAKSATLASVVVSLFVAAVVAALAAAVAAAGAAAWALGRFVLEIEFHAFTQSILMGLSFGVISCLLAGYRFQKKIQSATAIECLRAI